MNEKIAEIVGILNNVIEDVKFDESMCSQDLQVLGMDSIAFVKVIIEIEDTYDIEVPDKYLMISAMNTIEKITEVLVELTE